MNHSGNEHLSSGSPRAGVLTKDFVSNIWYTLYFSTGKRCWNTAREMECPPPRSDISGGKKKKGVGVACQKTESRPLHVTNLWRNVNDCQSRIFFFFPLWGCFHSFTALKRFHLCLWSMYYLITKRETEISRGRSLGAITRLGQHSRLSDKVCLYLALPPLVFLLRFNLRAAPRPLLLF